MRSIILLMSTFFLSSYGLTYVFENNTDVNLDITAGLPALKKGVPGPTACRINLPAHQTQTCNTDICPTILKIQKNIFQAQNFEIGTCQNTKFIINKNQKPTTIAEFSLKQQIIK